MKPSPVAPLPWTYRKMSVHFVIEAADQSRVAEVRFIGRPDGSTSEDQAKLIVESVNASRETERSIAADCYWHIADVMKTEREWSVQEHVEWMRELLQDASAYLHDACRSDEGGDSRLVELARRVRMCLDGKAPGHLDPLDATDELEDEA